jgi:hypothetical protein
MSWIGNTYYIQNAIENVHVVTILEAVGNIAQLGHWLSSQAGRLLPSTARTHQRYTMHLCFIFVRKDIIPKQSVIHPGQDDARAALIHGQYTLDLQNVFVPQLPPHQSIQLCLGSQNKLSTGCPL